MTRTVAREVTGGGPRPGRAACECQFGPSTVHDPTGWRTYRRADGKVDAPSDCARTGTMHDGWFICGPCVRHAPQLDKQVRWPR